MCRKENRDKQDVYDYGAILLEIVLGRPPTIKNPFPQKRSELVCFSTLMCSGLSIHVGAAFHLCELIAVPQG